MDNNLLFEPSSFEEKALRIFSYQATHNDVYARYLSLIDCDVQCVHAVEDIPFLPIELFKSQKVYCGDELHELLFRSSGTTGMAQSSHYVKHASVYEEAFSRGWEQFYGNPAECNIYALLPSYLEREGSSLIYMFEKLIAESFDGGFFLYNHDELIERLARRDRSKKSILIGVTFALLDLAESGAMPKDNELIVMETGGMKGRGEELPRETVHSILREAFGVQSIHSEYGMCECLSQAYSTGDGIFYPSDSMRIVIRDIQDPFVCLGDEKRGGINIVDLANIHACSFIQTQDIGKRFADSSFTVEGRIADSDLRGCNLLIQ